MEKLFEKYMEDKRFTYILQAKSQKQMLVLNADDQVFEEQFAKEVANALKSDKYEQESIVRSGTNRVEKYTKTKGGKVEAYVTLISGEILSVTLQEKTEMKEAPMPQTQPSSKP